MTDEEGKSIEDLSEFFEYAQDMINDLEYDKPVDVTIYQSQIDSYRILLNLLSKLITKIEKQEEEINAEDNRCAILAIKKHSLEEKNMKLEKVIDEMAKEILRIDTVKSKFEYDHAKVWDTENGIKKYFYRKVEEDE